MGWLVSIDAVSRGGMCPVDQNPVSIGSSADSDVRTVGPGVSDRHAAVSRRGREFVLTDLDSSRGTFVNGNRVHEQVLSDGDRIRIGDCEWVFKSVALDQP
jgi:pSer/pThr/pTyr-binding forkhead associated (FHA) protein